MEITEMTRKTHMTRNLLGCIWFGAVIMFILTLLFLGSGRAGADTSDDAYLSVLSSHGLYSSGGTDSEIQLGHWICTQIDSGTAPNAVARSMASHNSTLTESDFAVMAGAAVGAYCPWDSNVPYTGREITTTI